MPSDDRDAVEPWCEVDAETESAEPQSAAAVLKTVAETVGAAPPGTRFAVRIEVSETTTPPDVVESAESDDADEEGA